jgi:hypothetical protein
MFAANAYRIHFATAADADALHELAENCSQRPLEGRVLIGEIAGTPAAELSFSDGRVIVDSSQNTGRLVATLRMRVGAIKAYEAMPSLRDRLIAALPPSRGKAVVMPLPLAHPAGSDQAIEKEAA